MKGTVAPPSSRSTAVLTWLSCTLISAASWRMIFCMFLKGMEAGTEACHRARERHRLVKRRALRGGTSGADFLRKTDDFGGHCPTAKNITGSHTVEHTQ